MSIFTEQADLEAVLAMISDREDVDSQNIFLAGASQGGVVSAITAAVNPDKERFERVEDIPAAYRIMGMEVGRVYAEDLLEKKENCNEIYREKERNADTFRSAFVWAAYRLREHSFSALFGAWAGLRRRSSAGGKDPL